MFTEMLIKAQSRGSAATGVMLSYYNRTEAKNKTAVIRAPIPASEFVKSKEYLNLLDKLNNDAYFIVGHTRAVTNGDAMNNKNNHPHRAGRIIGVHNGNISNYNKIWNFCSPDFTPTGSCDSEAIFAMIEKYRMAGKDMHEAVGATVEKLSGWWALAMMDIREPSKLVFLKDRTTDLDLAWIPHLRVGVIASKGSYILDAGHTAQIWKSQISMLKSDVQTIYTLDSLQEDDNHEMLLYSTELGGIVEHERTAEEEAIYQTTLGH